MAIFRSRPREQFTQIRNKALRDPRLKLSDKGLLALMLSFHDDWKYRLEHLEQFSSDGRDAHRASIQRLMACGYVVRQQTRTEGGKLGEMEYVVSDECLTVDGFSGDGFSGDGGYIPTNTDLTNTDKNKEDKDMSPSSDTPAFPIPENAQEGQEGAAESARHTQVGSSPPKAVEGQAKAFEKVPGGGGELARKMGGAEALRALHWALINAWNENRDKLPAAKAKAGAEWPLSDSRSKLLNAFIKQVGPDQALPVWIDAVREVAKDEFWITNRYTVDNLTRHAEAKAEKFAARSEKPAVSARDGGYDGKGWV